MFETITFSTLDVDFCKQYMRIEESFKQDDTEIQLYLDSAKYFIIEYTEMDTDALDKVQYVPIILLKMVTDFYENKSFTTKDNLKNDPTTIHLLSKLRAYNLGYVCTEGEEQ